MKIQEKPDYLIFADSAKKGEVSDFPDVSRGWGVTIEQTGSKPPLEWMNGAFNRVDKNMLYLLQQGVPEWSESVKYPVNAIIKYNGVLYTAIAENDNSNPAASTTKWKKTQAEVSKASTTQSGIVKLNSSTDSTSETEAATPLAVKKANDNAISANNKANIANANAISANSNANNAHKNIEVLGGRISAVEDKFTSGGVESRVYSHDKRFYLIVRDDGVVGLYNTVRDTLTWGFGEDGVLGDGYVPAHRVLNLEQYIRNFTLPPGIPLPWPQVHPPAGWFECNGAQFDVNQFPRLASAYPAGRLPDLRGEFIRGWDNARGADPYRVMLSWQNCEIQRHNHGQNIRVFSEGGTGNPWGSGGDRFELDYWFNTGESGGNETRPRNVAFMYIVKAE